MVNFLDIKFWWFVKLDQINDMSLNIFLNVLIDWLRTKKNMEKREKKRRNERRKRKKEKMNGIKRTFIFWILILFQEEQKNIYLTSFCSCSLN